MASYDYEGKIPPKYNSNNNYDGTYQWSIPALECGEYEFNIHYGISSDNVRDAADLGGTIVVGHRPVIVLDPVIAPFTTSADTEEDITDDEKLASTFSFEVNAFYNNYEDRTDVNSRIQGANIMVRFIKGILNSFVNTTTSYAEVESAYKIPNKFKFTLFKAGDKYSDGSLVPANNYGSRNLTYTFQNLFDTVSNITEENTLYVTTYARKGCGETNVIPTIYSVPLILGSKKVFVKVLGTSTDDEYIVMGKGSMIISVRAYHRWCLKRENGEVTNTINEDYIDYANVLKGNYHFQYAEVNDDGTLTSWRDIPASELTAYSGTNTQISSVSGVTNSNLISGTDDNTTGVLTFIWTNSYSADTEKELRVRFVYDGVVGDTKSQTSGTFTINITPTTTTSTSTSSSGKSLKLAVNDDDSEEIPLDSIDDTPITITTMATNGVEVTINGTLTYVLEEIDTDE